jgi:rhodanese-related sulfurtransferase
MSATPDPTTVEHLLEEARAGLDRLEPAAALAAQRQGAILVDIRSESQRRRDGLLPGATVIARNVLEWRLDPACPHREPTLARPGLKVIVVCDEGYQSSLAAATLRRFGIDATDLVGGAQAWAGAGLPMERNPTAGPPHGAVAPSSPGGAGTRTPSEAESRDS